MSEHLAAAAQKMGVPEAMVQRSAEARAKASGTPVDDILEAWAGGEAVSASASAAAGSASATASAEEPAAEPAPAAAPKPAAESPAPAPEPAPAPTAQPAPAPAPAPAAVAAVPARPPVLVGRTDRPFLVMAGVAGLAVLTLILAVLAPTTPQENPGALTSEIAFSQEALAGREVYLREGCAACHTQMVRRVVADAGLGPVTLSDTNAVLGTRRYGPDLAHIGSRVEDPGALRAALEGGLESHPRYSGLSDGDLADLVAYLAESR